MMTFKLYQQNPYLKTCVSEIIEANLSKDGLVLVLQETIFFPVGGGQSCDKGKINDFDVTSVYENNGIVYHQLQLNNSNVVWNVGDKVTCEIDWNHRFLNMQRHCGEHILSGIFYEQYGGVNRGFHMGEDYMTIDISLEENPDHTVLTWDMCTNVESKANSVVWSNVPVITRYFNNGAEAADLPLRKKLTVEENISIVCVGDISNPSDCVACCGTHPSTAGQVGLIKILKVESYKGMFRVYCDAGSNAMALFNQYHRTITTLGNKYSANIGDLLNKIAVQEEKNKAVRTELYVLKQSVTKIRITYLRSSLEQLRNLKSPCRVFIKAYEDMTIDDLLNLGRPLIPDLDRVLALVSKTEKVVLLFSNGSIDCGQLVKDNAPIYQGKGGGNKNNARALFTKAESIDTFLDLLEKHLR